MMGATLRQPTDCQGLAAFPRNVRAVTGACLLTPRAVFERLGGFDERALPVAFSDIDYCLRLAEHGLRVALAPQARLVHHESRSRGTRLAGRELAEMAARWRGVADPYWHPARSRENHLLEIDSRRQARGLAHRLAAPRIAFLAEPPINPAAAPPHGLARRLAATGHVQPLLCPAEGNPGDVVRVLETLQAPEAWLIDGAGLVGAVEAARQPVVWRIAERLLVRDGSPAEALRLVRIARAMRQAYQVVYGEPHTRAWAQAGWMGENQRFFDALPELPPLPRDEARRQLGLGADGFVVAFASDLPAALRQALAALPFVERSVCIGADGLALGHVRELRVDDPRLAAAADAFIHHPCARLRDEPALQALAAGVPFVATRFAEHADLVQFGASAVRIAEHDPADLARALAELHGDPERRRALGDEGRHWLASRSAPEHVHGQWAALLREAAELAAPRAGSGPSAAAMESFTKSCGIAGR